jgi:hypothetical protein
VPFLSYLKQRYGDHIYDQIVNIKDIVNRMLVEAVTEIDQEKYKKILKNISKASQWKKSKK